MWNLTKISKQSIMNRNNFDYLSASHLDLAKQLINQITEIRDSLECVAATNFEFAEFINGEGVVFRDLAGWMAYKNDMDVIDPDTKNISKAFLAVFSEKGVYGQMINSYGSYSDIFGKSPETNYSDRLVKAEELLELIYGFEDGANEKWEDEEDYFEKLEDEEYKNKW